MSCVCPRATRLRQVDFYKCGSGVSFQKEVSKIISYYSQIKQQPFQQWKTQIFQALFVSDGGYVAFWNENPQSLTVTTKTKNCCQYFSGYIFSVSATATETQIFRCFCVCIFLNYYYSFLLYHKSSTVS